MRTRKELHLFTLKIDSLRETYSKKIEAFTALGNSVPQLRAELGKINTEAATAAGAGDTASYLRLQDEARVIEGKIHVATVAKRPTADYENEALPAWNEFKKSHDKSVKKALSSLDAARLAHVEALIAAADVMNELTTVQRELAGMTDLPVWYFELEKISDDDDLLKAENAMLQSLRLEGDNAADKFRTVIREQQSFREEPSDKTKG